jgi:hypothetical protein
MKRTIMTMLVAALAVGCGDDGDDQDKDKDGGSDDGDSADDGAADDGDDDGADGSGDDSADGDDSAGGSGYCSESGAVVMCDGATNCAFDPATIDCMVACNNVGALCQSGCSGSMCEGFDAANCSTGCNFAKNQACPNVTFGCYAMSSDCDTVGSCIEAHQ